QALIGDINQDGSIQAARERILLWLAGHMESLTLVDNNKDPKTRLQEYLQSQHSGLPHYEVVDISGEAHCRTFRVECRVELMTGKTSGVGSSRRLAEQEAARLALIAMGVEKSE